MPLKNGKLTRQEARFAKAYGDTGSVPIAANRAGYHPANAGRVLQRPDVIAEAAKHAMARLTLDALPAAVDALISLVRDERTPAGARVQAAKVIMDRALGTDNVASDKAAHEMTSEELARAIADAQLRAATLESVKADRARPVIDGEAAPKPDIFG